MSPTVFRNRPGRPRTQCTARSMAAGSRRGSYQVAAVCGRSPHGAPRDGLDRLHRHPSLLAASDELLEVGRVAWVPHHRVVVGQQHGIEVESLQGTRVHGGHRRAVAGHTDEAHQPLLAGLDGRFQRPARSERRLPLRGVDEVVELDQVDLVDAQSLQGAADLVVRRLIGPLAGLRGEEDVRAVLLQPGTEPELRVAIAGGGVDVVDAEAKQQLHRAVRLGLRHIAERRRAKDGASALVTGPAERSPSESSTRSFHVTRF